MTTKPNSYPLKHQPMYGWSLDAENKPIPIAKAETGKKYYCPVCHGEMIPKKGKIKQHHFAHANLLNCTPETVARAVAGAWIVATLREHLAAGDAVTVTWKTQDEIETHTINILQGIDRIEQEETTKSGIGDIGLFAGEKLKVAILLGIEGKPDPKQVTKWIRQGVTVILLNPEGVRGGQLDLKTLLEQSSVLGGWWLLEAGELPATLETDPQFFTTLFTELVSKPPYTFYRGLKTAGTVSHLLEVNGRQYWLPIEFWRDVIGGSNHTVRAGVDVMIQEWAQPDNGKIMLFYVTTRKDCAIGIRRYMPQEDTVVRLSGGAFLGIHATAEDIARQLTGGRSMTLPS